MLAAIALEPETRLLGGDAETDDSRHVLGSAAPIALLRTADHLASHPHTLADDEPPHSLRTVELVGGETQEVDRERVELDRQLSHPLRRVGVESHAGGATALADLGNRLNQSGLVVGPHE